MIKDTMKRKKPSFDESYYGYRSFTHLLEDGDNLGLVDIERNPKSGTYMVTRICGEGAALAAGPKAQPSFPARPGPVRQRATGARRLAPLTPESILSDPVRAS